MTVSACLWLGFFPLVNFGTYRSLTGDKWLCMLILTGLTLVCFLADILMRRVSPPRLLPLLCGTGLLLWTVISCLFSPFPGTPWWLGTGRREGLATQLCYLALFFIFAFSKVRRTPVLIASGCGVFLFSAVVLLQRSGGNPLGLYPESYSFENASYFQGTIGNVDMCSGYLVIVCGLFLSALVETLRTLFCPVPACPAGERSSGSASSGPCPEKRPGKLSGWIMLVFLVPVLFLSAWLLFTMDVDSGVVALAVLLVWTAVRFLPKKYRLPALILLLAAVLLLAWFWPGETGPVFELREILHGRIRSDFGSGRVGIWGRTLAMLREDGYLLTGTGADTFAMRFSAYQNRYELAHPDTELIPDYYDSPHCEYLAMLVNSGVPALLCFLVLIAAGCFGVPVWRDSVLGYGVQAFLSFSVCIVAPMFWVLLGLSLARPPDKSARKT